MIATFARRHQVWTALLVGAAAESIAALVGFLVFDLPVPFLIGGALIELLTVWLLWGWADSHD
jgi:hypothetical protein